jgi:hypothetical protein
VILTAAITVAPGFVIVVWREISELPIFVVQHNAKFT